MSPASSSPASGGGRPIRPVKFWPIPRSNTGNVDSAFAAAPVKISGSSYMVHYNMHGPIGPTCCVADVKPNGAVAFSNTQNAYSDAAVRSPTHQAPRSTTCGWIYYEGGKYLRHRRSDQRRSFRQRR